MSDDPFDRGDPTPPDRTAQRDRGAGKGRFLEDNLAEAFHRWEYETAKQVSMMDTEIDVIARYVGDEDIPPAYRLLVGEAKDYEKQQVNRSILFKLIAQSFAVGGMPVLCTTGDLTKGAYKTARQWDIRVLTYRDMHKKRLPRPPGDRRTANEGDDHDWTRSGVHLERGPRPITDSIVDFYQTRFDPLTGSPEYRPDANYHGRWPHR